MIEKSIESKVPEDILKENIARIRFVKKR